jgi:hypothetical protein
MRPIVQILFFRQVLALPQRSMATKRGKNKPNILVTYGAIEPELPRTLILLGGPRKRVRPQSGHLLLPCNTLKYQESAPNCGLSSNFHRLQPHNWV